jgi:hypothetical protein
LSLLATTYNYSDIIRGVGTADHNEHNLDHPLINDHNTDVILTRMVPYIARVPGKLVAPGGAKWNFPSNNRPVINVFS